MIYSKLKSLDVISPQDILGKGYPKVRLFTVSGYHKSVSERAHSITWKTSFLPGSPNNKQHRLRIDISAKLKRYIDVVLKHDNLDNGYFDALLYLRQVADDKFECYLTASFIQNNK